MKRVVSIGSWLAEPVDNVPLLLFRAWFGLLLFLEGVGAIATGWVREVYVDPELTFPHIGFGWLEHVLSGPRMYAYYAVMSVPGFLVMIGAWFRPAVAAYGVMWTGVYLGQTTSYNNHYYLMILLCMLMWITPANADFSLDAERGRVRRSSTCPRWCIAIFVALLWIVYSYAAIAKLDADWLAARPVEIWLRAKESYPVLGRLYAQPWLKWPIVYGGILFDGLIVPMLLWRRTRWPAVVLSFVFHLFNSFTFRIGVFPYMMLASLVLFFPGEPIRRWLRTTFVGCYLAAEGVSRPELALGAVGKAFLAIFFVMQILLPLRHLLYPGNSHWTEEGHRMSWHMMLRTKSGSAVMRVVDRDTGATERVYPRQVLSSKQVARLATRPDMLWRFSRHLRERAEREGRDVAVYADTQVSLNGRPAQPLVDPQVDLSRAPWTWFTPLPWLVPLRE